MSRPLAITVISDVICPWCYLGKTRLERGAALAGVPIRTSWRAFELNPDMPDDGMPREEYRARKFGAERARALDAQMAALGREEGVAFAFERQARTPATRRAHALIAFAGAQGRDDALAQVLFEDYFENGADLSREEALVAAAVRAGLDAGHARAALADPDLGALVEGEAAQARRLGVSGVPFFVIEERYAVSGAQPAETWAQVLADLAARGEPVDGAPSTERGD